MSYAKRENEQQPNLGQKSAVKAPRRVPSYRRKVERGREVAVVTLPDPVTGERKDYRLGAWGSPESHERYSQLISEWQRRPLVLPAREKKVSGVTVANLVEAYLRWMGEQAYSRSQKLIVQSACKPLLAMYASTRAAEIDAADLRAARDSGVRTDPESRHGWARKTANRAARHIISMFRWGAVEKLVPASVAVDLAMLRPIRRAVVPDPEDIESVPLRHVAETMRELLPAVAAMVRLQYLTGLRSQDITDMQVKDVNRKREPWILRAGRKTEYRGYATHVPLGPRSMALLAPLLTDIGTDYVFRTNTGRGHYSAASYRRAITRAANRAKVPEWHPHQLRHGFAERVERIFGTREAAMVALAHKRIDTTAIYTGKNAALHAKIAQQIG